MAEVQLFFLSEISVYVFLFIDFYLYIKEFLTI